MQRISSIVLSCSSMHDLRRLRAFHAVAEKGSFSAAALELGYAQSVVSHHVASLERELGVTLVHRAVRPVRLTDAGERVLPHVHAVLGHVAAAEDEVRAIVGMQRGMLRLGAFLSACQSFVPRALSLFRADHPGIDVVLEQVEEPVALRGLRAGELDVAVVWREAQDPTPRAVDGLEEVHLADDPYRVVLPLGHPLARRHEVRMAELAGERFNAPPPEGVTRPFRELLRRLSADAGFEPDVAYVLRDVTVARAFVAAGLCVTLMAELMVPEPRSDVVVRPLHGAAPARTILATWRSDRHVPSLPAMIGCLADAARARLG
jgi:DNA-binding transcriptional LysR family regulator